MKFSDLLGEPAPEQDGTAEEPGLGRPPGIPPLAPPEPEAVPVRLGEPPAETTRVVEPVEPVESPSTPEPRSETVASPVQPGISVLEPARSEAPDASFAALNVTGRSAGMPVTEEPDDATRLARLDVVDDTLLPTAPRRTRR